MKKVLTTVLLFIILCTSVFSLLGCTHTINLREKILVYQLERFLKLFEDEDVRLQTKWIVNNYIETYYIDGINTYTSSFDSYFSHSSNYYTTYEDGIYWLIIQDKNSELGKIGRYLNIAEYLDMRNNATNIYPLVKLIKENPSWMEYDAETGVYELIEEECDYAQLYEAMYNREAPEQSENYYDKETPADYNVHFKFKNGKLNYVSCFINEFYVEYDKNIAVTIPDCPNGEIIE